MTIVQTIHRFLLILVVAIPSIAMGASIISGPLDPRATHCGWSFDDAPRADHPVVQDGANKICSIEINSIAVGAHTVNATAVAISSEWPRIDSAPSATLNFTRPGAPNTPAGLRLQNGIIVSNALSASATHCGWVINGTAKTDVPVGVSGSTKTCAFDATSLPAGNHTAVATAVVVDAVWGRLESASTAPFAFAKPGPLGAPSGLRQAQ